MANCKDNCIHYRVCMYGDLTEYKTEQILKDDCDDYMSNDVVPKSEIESINPIQEAIEQKKKESKGFALGVLNELLDEKDAEIKRLEYTLTGVMHSVDKWLDGEELEQDEVNRAITMREKTLRIIEGAKSKVKQIKWERDVAIKQLEEIGLSFGEKTDGYGNLTEYAREIFEEIQKIFVHRILHNESQYFEGVLDNVTKDLDELKKKYTESEDK